MAELEYEVRVIPINEDLPRRVEEIKAEGFELMQGVTPVAVYHVVRVRKPAQLTELQQTGIGAIMEMGVDDNKVHIVRNGKIVPN